MTASANAQRQTSRRQFLRVASVGLAAGTLSSDRTAAEEAGVKRNTSEPRREYCAFIKYLAGLSYDELAEGVAAAGFDGVEATVRQKDGYILPERAAEDLPAFKEALARCGLALTIATTDLVGVDSPHAEPLLKLFRDLGAKHYRLGFCRYEKSVDLPMQIDRVRSSFAELATLNSDLGLCGLYQNHSGSDYVGAPVWDLAQVFTGIDADSLGIAFDLRHATIEGGLSWPLHYRVVEPWVRALFAKDFVWSGRRAIHTPFGEGRVDAEFWRSRLRASSLPVSVHVEYLPKGGPRENLAALARDLATLKSLEA